MKTFILLSVCTLCLAVSVFAQSQQTGIDTNSFVHDISLIQLIATPEKYHQKIVQVMGYVNIEFEGNRLYLHKEDFDNRLSINGVRVAFSKRISQEKQLRNYSKKYVILIGTFDMYDGVMSSGSIKNITRLDSLRPRR